MVGTARTASEQISGILKQIQVKVVQADGADTDSLAKLQADVDALTVDETDKAAYPALAHAVLENQRLGHAQGGSDAQATPCRWRCARSLSRSPSSSAATASRSSAAAPGSRR